jgi:hypothetical protein
VAGRKQLDTRPSPSSSATINLRLDREEMRSASFAGPASASAGRRRHGRGLSVFRRLLPPMRACRVAQLFALRDPSCPRPAQQSFRSAITSARAQDHDTTARIAAFGSVRVWRSPRCPRPLPMRPRPQSENPVSLHHLGIPAGAELGCALLRGVVRVDDAEASGITSWIRERRILKVAGRQIR